jgi:hypothetical protein
LTAGLGGVFGVTITPASGGALAAGSAPAVEGGWWLGSWVVEGATAGAGGAEAGGTLADSGTLGCRNKSNPAPRPAATTTTATAAMRRGARER